MNLLLAGACLSLVSLALIVMAFCEQSTPEWPLEIRKAVIEVSTRDASGHFIKVSCPVCGSTQLDETSHFDCHNGHHFQEK